LNITIGVIFIALSYYFLFLPHNLVTGGVTGIAIILKELFGEAFMSSIFIYISNLILLVFGFIVFGKEFLFKTIYGSLLLPTIVLLFELLNINPNSLFEIEMKYFSEMNPISEIILSVVFGSLLTGFGLGLCFRNNSSTGGMDILQKIIVKFFHFPFSKTIYITDGIIIAISLFVFGIEQTMYSLFAIYLIGIFLDIASMGVASRRTAFVISDRNEEIKKIIIEKLGRGVTVIPAFGGYSLKNYEMLVSTLNKNESYLLKDLILEIDPNAFTFFVSAKEVYGDGFE
jgi:uncharacterized membrane-anchored protein YitT (DUF2179 family)